MCLDDVPAGPDPPSTRSLPARLDPPSPEAWGEAPPRSTSIRRSRMSGGVVRLFKRLRISRRPSRRRRVAPAPEAPDDPAAKAEP